MSDQREAADLDQAEQALVTAIRHRAGDIVDLASSLIRFDTQSRAAPEEPARDEAALQQFLAERLAAAGASVDVWEPEPSAVADHPLCPPQGIGFAGRPQLAARFGGRGGDCSLLFNGHIDVVRARRDDGWDQDPFQPRVRNGELVGRGSCDMKGGIAAMVVAAEALVAAGDLTGELIICTNTDEESTGVGGLACARHGVRANFAVVPEPTGLEVWPACRGSAYCTISVPGRSGHAEQHHAHWHEGGAVNAIDKARLLLAGVDTLTAEWQTRTASTHPLLAPPALVATRLVADSDWAVTIPNQAEITLAMLVLPYQADADGWTRGAQREVEEHLRRVCATDSWLAAHPPQFAWHTQVNPSETPSDAPIVRALLAANAALGLPVTLGGLGSWYDGATFAAEAHTPAVMYGPRHIDRAHTVGESVPVDDLIACAQGLAVAARRLLT